MSTTRSVSFELKISPDEYVKGVYLDPDFTRALYDEGLAFVQYSEVELHRSEDGSVRRHLRLTPPSNAPKVVQKALGKSQDYDEYGELDTAGRWTYRVVPKTMGNRISVEGSMSTQATPAGCRVTFQATFSVSIFGVGSAVERFMAGQFEDNLQKQEAFTRRWLARGQ